MRRDSLAIAVEGELDIARIEELDRLVAPALAGEGVDVIIDIGKVTFLDSTGLGWLLRTQDNLKRCKGSLRVVSAGQAVLPRLLSLTGLQDQINLYANLADAERDIHPRAM